MKVRFLPLLPLLPTFQMNRRSLFKFLLGLLALPAALPAQPLRAIARPILRATLPLTFAQQMRLIEYSQAKMAQHMKTLDACKSSYFAHFERYDYTAPTAH
jgi:hypothetical protein